MRWAGMLALMTLAPGCTGLFITDVSPSVAGSEEIVRLQSPPKPDHAALIAPEVPAFEWIRAASGEPSDDPSDTQQQLPFPKLLYLDARKFKTPERLERGYTLILPGIEGRSPYNFSVARGLNDSGLSEAIEVYDWTTGHWPLFLYHLSALERNREQAERLAAKIVAYQQQYPGRPVRLVGHSGGGAMAVFTLEALPEGHQVEQVILLAAAISPEHDLRTALARTRRGIWNFSSRWDWFSLGIGTSVAGTLDRQRVVSAGNAGFDLPADESGRRIYAEKLHEQPFSFSMARSLNFGGHEGAVQRLFVRNHLGPLVRADEEPARTAERGAAIDRNAAVNR